MIGALWTGISGLSSQQKALDNESHNIANVNTVGYKASRISFADQMYQDRIGKGSKVLDAEKLYVQGNLKDTGVAYDMALNGNGFFTVADISPTGSSETYYTRAGNFRMGDNGTLQDAAGNEVQGWAMEPLTEDDITSTNANISMFTSDYSELLATAVVNKSSFVETYTARSTDYTQTAKADGEFVFSGYGLKTKSSKTADIDALVANYASALKSYQEDPDGSSASAISQISQIKFSGDILEKEGDQIYVYIDGNKISQNFVTVIDETGNDANGDGLTGQSTGYTAEELQAIEDADNLAASKIETYKQFANEISKTTGLVAYNIMDSGDATFQSGEKFTKTTIGSEVLNGMIQIEGIVPGQEFKLTEVAEVSGTTTKYGTINDTSSATAASAGYGIGGLESARDALSKAISGNQRDVFTVGDINTNGADDYEFKITVYDKETKSNVLIGPIAIDDTSSIENIASGLNNGGYPAGVAAFKTSFEKYFTASVVNGQLVIETNDQNYDIEFSTEVLEKESVYSASGAPTVQFSGTSALLANGQSDFIFTSGSTSFTISSPANLESIVTSLNEHFASLSGDTYVARINGTELEISATGTNAGNNVTGMTLTKVGKGLEKNADYSGRKGAGGEFLEIKTTIDQGGVPESLQLKLDTLGISDSAFGEFSVDSTGLITMKQDDAEFAIGQVSIALFNNERGLEPMGDNLLAKTVQSGEPTYNINNDRTANIEAETLELSTADLSESLVNLMVFQRAFEANAKSITTSDTLLSTLINLKR